MPTPAWRMSEINALDRDTFVARFGVLFEGSPWIAAAAWDSRPWHDVASLHQAMLAVIRDAAGDRQLALIRAHPDLVGRAALAGTLSRESSAEQRAAGLDPDALSAGEIARFHAANNAYQERFGFPFVICARENRKETILAGLKHRLDNERQREIKTALAEIGKIAWHRLVDLVDDQASTGDDGVNGDAYHCEVSYGKHGVAVYRVYAAPLRDVAPIPESAFTGRDNNLLACEIGVQVFGDEFLPAYTQGDNSMVVATDSMKNFIIRESLNFPGATLEGLLHFLGTGFVRTYEQLHTLTMDGREIPFSAMVVPDGRGAFHAGGNLFSHYRGDRAFASLSLSKSAGGIAVTSHRSGISGMELMKLTGSAFTSFVRDGYTTLPERGDRPLYIHLDVAWHYEDVEGMLDLKRRQYVPTEQMRDLLAATFDDFVSESIQHLLHEMGSRVLERFSQLVEIEFTAQNRTRDPYGQRSDEAHVRVYSDPFPAFGKLTLRMRRAS